MYMQQYFKLIYTVYLYFKLTCTVCTYILQYFKLTCTFTWHSCSIFSVCIQLTCTFCSILSLLVKLTCTFYSISDSILKCISVIFPNDKYHSYSFISSFHIQSYAQYKIVQCHAIQNKKCHTNICTAHMYLCTCTMHIFRATLRNVHCVRTFYTCTLDEHCIKRTCLKHVHWTIVCVTLYNVRVLVL